MTERSSMQAPGGWRRSARGWLAEAGDAVASVFFPSGCRICEQLLTSASRVPICQECLDSFQKTPQRRCETCGLPLPTLSPVETDQVVCPACQEKTYAFEKARAYGIYSGALTRAILLLKWERIEPLGTLFAERLMEVMRKEGSTLAADLVVPVPLHRARERERGYNQAGLIAKPLARKLGLPYKAVLLMRTRPRPNKQILSIKERWESVRGAFATRPGSQIDNKRVLLVDDVMTTGATLDACSSALLESGAKSVVGLTVARAVENPLPAQVRGKLSQVAR